MIKHRKKEHSSRVAPCKNFLEGNCSHTSESCHWIHGKDQNQVLDIKCFVCGENFSNKREVMKHRKRSHKSLIEPCSKFLKRECPFQEEFCWFKHENLEEDKIDENKEDKSNSGFQEAPKPLKPPLNPKV